MEQRLAAAASYVFLLPALLLMFLPRYRGSRFVRFHAMQSILLTGVEIALGVIAYLLLNVAPILGVLLGALTAIGAGILWALLVIKTLQGKWFEVPGLGQVAARMQPKEAREWKAAA